ncbi:RepB family plasmid replication initiator protein [Clostridium sp.]|uniref:RepB family plasmid replication initiator protein n=1 Tax=Clostridium sp. TaxID=1506 RepID=UPI003F363DBD
MNNEILFKPNGIILATASNTITSSEYKLFDMLLQRCQLSQDSNWRKAEFNREELKKIIKSNDNSTVAEIKETLDKFMNINIKFKLGKKDVSATLIAEHIYDHERDMFTCSMSKNVFKALMICKEIGYSPIDIKLVRKAKSFYTQKIYGILRMWSRHNETIEKVYTLNQIKEICDIFEGTSYDRYNNFKNKVLVPAIKEINEKLNMKVTFNEIKVMRKVQKIEFIITDYETKKYNFNKITIIDAKEIKIKDEHIDSVDYMNMIDCKLNESIHKAFLKDFSDYKDYIKTLKAAANKTLDAIGGKTINKKNYKYFKTTLENLIPSRILDD